MWAYLNGQILKEDRAFISPLDRWKLGNIGESWFVGDTVNIGIGQGYITSTPLQLAVALSAIVNKGKIYKPQLVINSGPKVYTPVYRQGWKRQDSQRDDN